MRSGTDVAFVNGWRAIVGKEENDEFLGDEYRNI